MIVTCKKQVPFRWIAFAILPWASFSFNGGVIGNVYLYSLKKFVENPAALTFILTLPAWVSLVLQPICSFVSDRIWTRFGRRKPFVTASLCGMAICLILLPLMPNFWALLAIYVLYSACADLNSPMEPLKLEIIPPHERGRATGAMTWCSNLGTMTFFIIAFGRFDDVAWFGGFPVRGETAIYWSAALLLIVMVLLITLGIHELEQPSALRGQRLTPRNFLGGLADRELWPVYMLVVGAACLNFYSGLGMLSNLLYTDQWNYTKQEMGINVFVGGVINVFAIGLLTIFADKLNRMRAYQTLICLSLAMQVAYYCYVNFVLPDKHPTLVEIIFFGETLSILSILTGLVYTPLVYDYIQRNKMGTFNAGAGVVNRLTTLITFNGVGLFVWGYATLFQPPSGEMTRVTVADPQTTQTEILATLRAASWTYPADNSPAPVSAISATSWRADGTISDRGACWEIRLRDPDSRKLAEEHDRLTEESSPVLAEEKMIRDTITVLKGKGRDAAAEERKLAADQARSDSLDQKAGVISAELTRRAKVFHDEVAHALASSLLVEGNEILNSTAQAAVLLDLPIAHRLDPHQLDKITAALRQSDPGIIDLRPIKRDNDGYAVTISALLPPGREEGALAESLQRELEIAAKGDPSLLMNTNAILQPRPAHAVTLNLEILEDPVPTYISPITRVVNAVLVLFGDAPDPRRRLEAIARGLRVPGQLEHVRIEPGPAPKTLTITAVTPDAAPGAQALLAQLDTVAASQRITLAHPSLTSDYAPMKYDYMSGYLWMFVMGSLGIAITVAFRRIEARGIVRKRGVEEAQQS